MRNYIVAILVLAFSSCAGTKINQEQLGKVKKVAIVGYTVQQLTPNSGEKVLKGLLGGSGEQNPTGMAMYTAPLAKPAPHVTQMFDDLEKDLENGMKWKVLSRSELKKNKAFQALYRDKMGNARPRPMVNNKNYEMYHPDGIIEEFVLRDLDEAKRDELISSLGVDAIAFVRVKVDLKSKGGLFKNLSGELVPVVKLGFQLYGDKLEDPIWQDMNVDSELEVADGVKHSLGFADNKPLNLMAIKTVEKANRLLIAKTKE